MRLIDADKLKERLGEDELFSNYTFIKISDMKLLIDDMPTEHESEVDLIVNLVTSNE